MFFFIHNNRFLVFDTCFSSSSLLILQMETGTALVSFFSYVVDGIHHNYQFVKSTV